MVITTDVQLADRLGIDRETLAIAAQTCSVKSYLRDFITLKAQSRVFGHGPDGKGAETALQAFERVFKEPLIIRGKRK